MGVHGKGAQLGQPDSARTRTISTKFCKIEKCLHSCQHPNIVKGLAGAQERKKVRGSGVCDLEANITSPQPPTCPNKTVSYLEDSEGVLSLILALFLAPSIGLAHSFPFLRREN